MVHLKLATPVFFEMIEGPISISVEREGKISWREKYLGDKKFLKAPPPFQAM